MKLIDAHIHFRPDIERFGEVAQNSGHINTEKHIKEVFEQNNIVHAIVMGNAGVEPSIHNYPEYMSYCVGLDASTFDIKNIETQIELVEKNLKLKKCVGIKLYPGYCPYYITDDIYKPFYELAQKYNKPVAVHTGATARSDAYLKYSHPLTLDDAAAMYPNVQFVMCHIGNPWITDAAAVLDKNPNVAADISGILEGKINMPLFFSKHKAYIDHIKMWLDYFGGYDRIMYGTDWPIVNIPNYIEFVSYLIDEKYHEDVFYNNAKRIYNIDI